MVIMLSLFFAALSGCSILAETESSAAPPSVIDVWYGSSQKFGHNGIPQHYVNILGSVSDPAGIASLRYSLNSNAEVKLAIGPDTRRLAGQGDFNIDIANTSLLEGKNYIKVTACNGQGRETVKNVTINFVRGKKRPVDYSVDWRDVRYIQDAAQVVDGKWQLVKEGVRSIRPGYDRLIAIGEISWQDYEVVTTVTIHRLDFENVGPVSGSGPAVGILMRWAGHTDNPVANWQPKSGYNPFGAIGWFRWNAGGKAVLEFYDTKFKQKFLPELETCYVFKIKVHSTVDKGGLYSLKVWQKEQIEPEQWTMEYQAGPSNLKKGSLMLVAHHVDATFGEVFVRQIPAK